MRELFMYEQQLTDTLYQYTNDITLLTRKVNVIEANLQILIGDQSKLSQFMLLLIAFEQQHKLAE